jgi:acyl-CoA synthetase (NDP forming)
MTPTLELTGMDALFAPSSIAVIGASSRRADAAGNQIIRNLQNAAYRGQIHVINPSGASIEGIRSVSAIADLPSVDVAVLAVPASSVLATLADLAAAGCPAAVVPSVGLSHEDERAVAELARRTGMLVHGPNCMGIIDVGRDTPMWIDEGILTDLPKGDVALVSQSGSAAIFVARSTTTTGFSKVISTGNEVATTSADYISWLARDPETHVIGVVLESIPDTAPFTDAVKEAQRAGKPVVVLKVGRTATGAMATTAHTGAILSSNEAYEAYFEYLDVPLVGDYDELATALECLSGLGARAVEGKGVGIVTISGGQAALAADLAESVGMELPPFSPEVGATLAGLLPGVLVHNPLDAGGSVTASGEDYLNALSAAATDPSVDALIVVLDAQESLNDVEIGYEEDYYRAVQEVARQHPDIPIVIASSSSMSLHPQAQEWASGSVPVLRGIRNALISLSAASKNRLVIEPRRPTGLPSAEEVRQLILELQEVSGPLAAGVSRRVLGSYGIHMVASAQIRNIDEAAIWAEQHGYPVVLKVDSPQIAHRSDVGGVEVGIGDATALRAAGRTIEENVRKNAPHAQVLGFEIQEQVSTDVEAFAGFVSDARLGQTVGLGLGGTLVELLQDTARAHAPFDSNKGKQLVASTRLGRVLSGYRNLIPATPTGQFAELTARLSWLAFDLGEVLSEADLNPVLIEPGTGLPRIVDCLLVARS